MATPNTPTASIVPDTESLCTATASLTIRWAAVERSPVRCPDDEAGRAMVAAIDGARAAGDTLGGVFTVIAEGVPPGLGSLPSGQEYGSGTQEAGASASC